MTPPTAKKPAVNKYPLLSPRVWHGMRLGDYLPLMWKNRFAIHPLRWPMALLLGPISCMNSVLGATQQLFHGRKIRATQLDEPPIFVIGHWRTGTSYLHELLCCDDRLAYPTNFDAVAANHFLVTAPILTKLLSGILPKRRPMDSMSVDMDTPTEDDFALIAMGGPTIYYRMAFPNRPVPYLEWLDMESVNESDLERFKRDYAFFLKALTYLKQKRLVLKSPPHTGRLELLAQMFPGAKFIHTTRDPIEVFESTRRAIKAMDYVQAFQIPRNEDLDEYVFENLIRMYRGFFRQRKNIDPERICDVRYDELAGDPVGQLEEIYSKLCLGDFEYVRPKLEAYVGERSGYRRNTYDLSPELQRQIRERWSDYAQECGYTDEPS